MPTYLDLQLEALGDATRREILDHLRLREMSVAEIAAGFRISRPAISQHLKILKDARLVIDRAEGNRHVYAINPTGFASLRDYVDRFWVALPQPDESSPEQSAPEEEDNSWRTW